MRMAIFKRGNGEWGNGGTGNIGESLNKTGNTGESLKREYRGSFKTGNFGESLIRGISGNL